MAISNKKSIITVFINKESLYSHQVLIALFEKGLVFNAIEVDPDNKPEELLELNPHGNFPTLVDRDLVLYDPKIILEYLDERFPHPPLLPVYPINRAQQRTYIHRIEKDWFPLAHKILSNKSSAKESKELTDSIVSLTPMFDKTPYFFSEDFTLTDCFLSPLFWRLDKLNVKLPPQAKSIHAYQKRLFERPTFVQTLPYVCQEEDL